MGKPSHVAIVGTGVIGGSWAAYFLAQGLDVTATDPAPDAEDALRRMVQACWPALETMGLADGASPSRLRFVATPEEAVEGVELVQENAPERLPLKQDLFRRLDAATKPDVLLVSSSSSILVSDMQLTCAHPERVVLGHPFNPPHLIPLVEVLGGKQTSSQTVERTMEFYRSIGKHPIHLKKEIRGHVANRLQAALWQEAFHLVDSGVATVADIDDAIAHGPGLRWALLGPFLNMHLSGGPGGMRHVMSHLGPVVEEMWGELGTARLTPDLMEKVLAGIDASPGAQELDQVVKARDAVLVKLVALKAENKLP